ncbi:hypothetical protein M0804_001931 [Polistes exclamans]|nr:hypothetical protein M0804_001931 [Polistes exclamans]
MPSAWLGQSYYKADPADEKRHATGCFDIPPTMSSGRRQTSVLTSHHTRREKDSESRYDLYVSNPLAE